LSLLIFVLIVAILVNVALRAGPTTIGTMIATTIGQTKIGTTIKTTI